MITKDVFDKFILYKEAEGKTSKTVKSYCDILHVFFKFFSSDNDISMLTEDVTLRYCAYINKNYVSTATRATYLRHFRAFIHWCNEKSYITSFSYKLIKIKKAKKRRTRYLSIDEFYSAFSLIKSSTDWLTLRDKALVLLLFDSGLRISETLLNISDINFNAKNAVLYGKGEKFRIVPLGDATLSYISEYLLKRPYKSDKLFITVSGTPLTVKAIQSFLNRLKHKTGLDICAHKLRHNFSENFLEDNYERTGSSNINELQIILGHSDIKTTMIYQDIFNEQLAAKNFKSHVDTKIISCHSDLLLNKK